MSGCWLWTGGVTGAGYGYFGKMGAHCYSYSVYKGLVPKGQCVCHKCDNKLCVNPDHLFAGTHKDNVRDMFAKGRENPPVGERQWCAKLTEQDVYEIRRIPWSARKTAELYNVGHTTIVEVRNRKRWKHI